MKKYIITFYIICCAVITVTGQSTTVYTCQNTGVAASYQSQGTSTQILTWTNEYLTWAAGNGMGAGNILGSAGNDYNCHAYAWHLTSGGYNLVWINNSSPLNWTGTCWAPTNNIAPYWTDGCFIQVCSAADADKIHYSCGDHSAITSLATPGNFDSKWGKWPLLTHAPNNVDYEQPTTQVYYASTAISGSLDILCSGTRTFSVRNITGASYAWSSSSTLSPVGSTSGNSLVVQPASDGVAWVEVQITSPCSASTATRRVYFYAGVPDPVVSLTINGVDPASYEVCHYTESMIIANPSVIETGTTYEWTLPSDWTTLQNGTNTASNPDYMLPVYPGNNGWVSVKRLNQCGYSSTYNVYVTFNPYCYSSYLISPNPASDNLTIDGTKQKKNIREVHITDKTGRVRKTVRFADKIQRATVNISGLTPDIYYIKIFDGKSWTTKPIIVKK
jgi:hypothetical protein